APEARNWRASWKRRDTAGLNRKRRRFMPDARRAMATAVRLKNYLEAFNGLEKTRRDHEPVWLHQLRAEGWGLFDAAGFPTVHDEDWRFTSLAPLARTQFCRAPKTAA